MTFIRSFTSAVDLVALSLVNLFNFLLNPLDLVSSVFDFA